MPKGVRMTQEAFLERMKENFGDKYDFSKSVFVNSKTNVTYVCPIHGEVTTKAEHLLHGYGCYWCGREATKKKMTDSQETFIEKAKKVHGDRYDLSKVKYVNWKTKVEIVCPIHGSYWVLPRTFLSGHNCPKCTKSFCDREYFIERAKEIHHDRYDYSKVDYKTSNTKVCIICKNCGAEFWQTPNSHLSGHGCECYSKMAKSQAARQDNIYGKAVNDYDGYVIDENGEYLDSYNTWFQMLRRCLSEKFKENHPTYKDCTVCEEWLSFTKFKEWFDDPNNGYRKGYQLDKDLIKKGNKVYSPETCCFISNELNSITTKADTLRNGLPIGVSKNGNKYRAAYSKLNKLIYIGLYDTPNEAFYAYKKAKEAWMKEYGDILFKNGEITERVREALYRYEVEITD